MLESAFRLTAALTVLFLTAACSPSKVLYDYDTQARFSSFRTFSFIEAPVTNPLDSQLITQYVRQVVSDEFSRKGLQPVDSIGDVEVAIISGAKDRVNVAEFGYSYWPGRWGWGGYFGGVEMYEYPEKTLIIDLVDSKKDQLIWRGSASKTLSDSGSPEKVEQRLKGAVELIMAAFPPGKD